MTDLIFSPIRKTYPHMMRFVFAAMVGLSCAAAHAAATSTTLAVTVAGTASTSSNIGVVQTLTATVTNTAASTTVTAPGTVYFCDATYDVAIGKCGVRAQLGSAQITSTGTAFISLRLAPGTHSLYAKFVGTPNGTTVLTASSSSASPVAYTVSGGSYPLTSVLSVGGSVSTYYNFTDTLISSPAAPTPTTPAATVSDATTGSQLGSLTFGTTGGTVQLSPPAVYAPFAANSAGSRTIVKGDFNNDGYLDLVDFSYTSSTYSLFVGSANGTFTPATPVSSINSVSAAITGDFNNDGYLDVAYINSGGLWVLINNKIGGFNAAVNISAFTYAARVLAAGDFNGDGNVDIFVGGGAASTNGYLQLFTNQGTTGTAFNTTGSFASTGTLIVYSLGAYDFNGDGYSDLIADTYSTTPAVLTYYQGASTFPTTSTTVLTGGPSTNSINLVVADLNNDGNPNIILPYSGNVMSIPTTNCATTCAFGTGSITAVANAGANSGIALGDVNNDGTLDVIVGTIVGSVAFVPVTAGVLGAPSFFAAQSSGIIYSVVSGDFTGDGLSDVAASTYQPSTPVAILFSGYQTTSNTLSNITLQDYNPLVTATTTTAAFPGGSVSNTANLAGGALTVTASPANAAPAGSNVTLTAQISTVTTTTNGHAPTGTIVFYDGTTALCSGAGCPTAANGPVSFTVTSPSVGTHAYSAQYAGDASNYKAYQGIFPLISPTLGYRVTAAAANKLAFLTLPTNASLGATPASSTVNTMLAGSNAGIITAAEVDANGNVVTGSTDIIQLEVKATLLSLDNIYKTGTSYASTTVGYLTPTVVNGVATFDLTSLPLYDKAAAASPGVIYTFTLTSTTAANVATAYASAAASVYVYTPSGGKVLMVTNFATDPLDIAMTAATNCPDQNTATPGTGSCSLRDAIAVSQVNTNSTIIFNYTGTPITISSLTNSLSLSSGTFGTNAPSTLFTKTATIAGPGLNNLTINGSISPAYYLFRQSSTFVGTLNISGMTLQNASAGSASYGGALYLIGTNVQTTTNVNSVAFLNNTGSKEGGAIYIAGNGTAPPLNVGSALSVSNSYFFGNTALNRGGAVQAAGGPGITISNSVFNGNGTSGGASTAYGGALSIENSAFNSTNVFTNDIFYNNNDAGAAGSTNYGGGVYVSGSGGVKAYALFVNDTIVGNKVSAGSASSAGGGIYVSGSGYVTLTNTVVEDNTLVAGSTKIADISSVTNTPTYNTSLYSTTVASPYASLSALGLSVLGNYGGRLQTLVPLPGSPLLKGGTAASTSVTTSPVLAVTSYAIAAANVATFAVTNNNEYVGESVTLSGFADTALNGQTVTVTAAAATGFSATIATHTALGASLAISSFVISGSNVGTFTFSGSQPAVNAIIALSGFGTSTYLNGASITVTSSTTTTFTGAFTHAAATATESGTGTVESVLSGAGTASPVTTTVAATPADARGFARPTSGLIDLGAVQSNLLLSFIDQPANVMVNSLITSAGPDGYPEVQLTDSGYNVEGSVPVTVNLSPGALTGTVTVSSNDSGTQSTSGYAKFSNLTPTTPQASTVLSAVTGTLGATSAAFSILGSSSQVVFGLTPATPIAAGGSPGTVTALIEDSGGNVVTSSSASVTLTVTGPAGFSTATYTATAVNGTATFSPASLTIAGAYTYSLASSGLTSPTAVVETVTAGATATKFTLTTPATATVGSAVNFTATATDAYGNAVTSYAGTVHFTSSDTAATLAADSTLSSGAGTFTVTFATAGSQTVTATDTVTSSITGTSGTTVVSKTTPTITLSSSQTPAQFGSSVTLTATLSPFTVGSYTTTGETITFLNNGTPIGTGTLNASGMATFTTSALPGGANSITATYAGDTAFTAATSAAFTQNVTGNSIFVINSNGTTSSFTTAGTSQTSATGGGGIGAAADAAGYLWSIDLSGNSVSRFNDDGTLNNDFAGGGAGISSGKALAIDGNGVVWIANGNGTVSALTSAGAPVSSVPVAAAAAISTPASLQVDTAGSLWIASQGNNTVVEIIGVAAPAVSPTVTGVINRTLGTKP